MSCGGCKEIKEIEGEERDQRVKTWLRGFTRAGGRPKTAKIGIWSCMEALEVISEANPREGERDAGKLSAFAATKSNDFVLVEAIMNVRHVP